MNIIAIMRNSLIFNDSGYETFEGHAKILDEHGGLINCGGLRLAGR